MARKRPLHKTFARVVKLADTLDLGSSAVRREGSSPSPSILKGSLFAVSFFCAILQHGSHSTLPPSALTH